VHNELDVSERSKPATRSVGAGEGPPGGTPYTVYFPDGETLNAADLAYPAPLPRVGDVVEFIDPDLVTHRYVVREVVHTLQAEPHPRGRGRSPAASDAPGAEARPPAELRAGLPEVFLERLGAKRKRRV
jgi:hypothetical protein